MDNKAKHLRKVEAHKRQFLKMKPAEILTTIIEEAGFGGRTSAIDAMREGLHAAVRERPSIAKEICPRLADPNDLRLAQLFLELIYDLWTVDEKLLVSLFEKLSNTTNGQITSEIRNCVDLYRDDDMEAGSKSEQFIAFLDRRRW